MRLLISLLFSHSLALADPLDRLKPLVGDWEAKTERGSIIRVSYKFISNDSVLVQRFVTPSGETMTVFHADGERVIATHYCAQGNQPRLRMDAKEPVFTFFDATNLKPNASHLTRLELRLHGKSDYDEIETYDQNDVTTLKFHRVR